MTAGVANTPGADPALDLLRDAYGSRLIRPGRSIQHPVAVAELLCAHGASATVVVAGLMHDVLEDTEVTADELRAVCGQAITQVVQALTEDASITTYRARKAALRAGILAEGPDAALISVADKLAKVQGLSAPPRRRKLRHYRATLVEAEERYGPTELSRRLRCALDRLD
ncbi:MAG TPA: HD domain-containing protein [Solirubrobacteraceae bacterium]|nr:HD domain-containing protein [Solirubrobacteraceae bacterium]